jgi:hypothetical protein
MKLKKAVIAALLIVLLAALTVFTIDMIRTRPPPDFHVGVEFAYSRNLNDSQTILSDLKALVDRVKNCTNLFIIGLPEVSLNKTLLTESCDYISGASLDFIVLYTDTTKYDYNLKNWTTGAQQNYGDKFLGVYRIDEPGGKELENATGGSERFLNPSDFSQAVRNYTGAAEQYVSYLNAHLTILSERLYPTIFTSDFGLYWFDYKAGYSTVLGEFVWNQSRQTTIALCRGAASVQNKDWGIIVTWMYDNPPYIESGPQLYDDLVLAYNAGAKYIAVFDSPMFPSTNQYGILAEEHFEALEDFWNYAHSNPQAFGADSAKVAYVVPDGYGFGFRNPHDTIWGIWSADDLAPKVFNDVNTLIDRYSSSFDIVYDDPQYTATIISKYGKLLFWNETIADS